jgi:hypothetical protein
VEQGEPFSLVTDVSPDIKLKGVRSGDRGGQPIGSPRHTYLFRNVASKKIMPCSGKAAKRRSVGTELSATSLS